MGFYQQVYSFWFRADQAIAACLDELIWLMMMDDVRYHKIPIISLILFPSDLFF